MSRPLVIVAALLFVVAGLAPILVMTGRVDPADFQQILTPRTLDLLGRTSLLGVSAAAIAVVIGAPFGFLVARTDLPGASWLRPLGVVPLLLPPVFLAITWTAMTELRGAWATILILSANTFPIVSFFTALAAERIDARREEAAILVGGKCAALRVELPLLLPAILCGASLAFVFAINDFAVPDYVSSVGKKFNVYSDEVFATWKVQAQTGKAVLTALPLLVLTLCFLWPALSLRRKGALATIGGNFKRPAPLRLARWRWPAFLFCFAVVGLTCLAPIGRMLWESGGGPRPAGWSSETMSAAFGLALERSRGDLGNSLVYSTIAGLLCLPIALVLGHAAERVRGGRIWEMVFVLPIAVPAILFGIGEIVLWNRAATADFYDSDGIVVLLYVGRFLPFTLLLLTGATASLNPRLEEAARLAGVGPARRLLRIVTPSLLPTLAGGWAMVFILSMRELDAAILVPAANHTVIFRVFNQIHFGRDDFVAALYLLVVFFLLLPGLLYSLFGRRKVEVMP